MRIARVNALLAPLVLAVVVAVPACPAESLSTSESTSDSAGSRVVWGGCPRGDGGIGMECAALEVPVDWDDQGGRTITLMVGRLRSDGDVPARGSVLVNFGGPGAPGIESLRESYSGAFAGLRHEMDIVTWDPRGFSTGLSTHLPCEAAGMQRRPAFPAGQAEFDALAGRNRAKNVSCRDRDPALFDNMGSADHARDMDAIRRALGESTVNLYLGSYGGAFGQAYARLFPRRIRTMVLDSTGNHTDPEREMVARARDSEKRFRRFAGWCEAEPSCVLHGRDVAAVWQALVARADREPVPAPEAGVRYDGVTLQELLAGRLIQAGPAQWPRLAEVIRDAGRGDASGFALSPQLPYPPMSGLPVTECADFPRFADHAGMAAAVRKLRRVAPNTGTGGTNLSASLACLGWPAPVSYPAGRLPAGLPPLLGVGAWADFGAVDRAVDQVRRSRSIYHDGVGHVLYLSGNACVTGHVDRYLAHRGLPPRAVEC